ncbi:MAG TPA: winged helix-turn-helix domain-containing protein [Polyangiaceae bacterium]|nr:winged helix-turn-helix domain-containing protein [Polyangiaceae bacterium]
MSRLVDVDSVDQSSVPQADLLVLIALGEESVARQARPGTGSNARPWSALSRTRELRKAGSVSMILAILPLCAQGEVPDYLYAGADDCLTWPVSPEELVARVYALVRRARASYHDDADLPLSVDASSGNVLIDGTQLCLKGKRLQIFVYLAQNRDRWVKSKELLKNVFQTHHRSDTSLVRVHIHRLKRSLGAFCDIIDSEECRGYRMSLRKCERVHVNARQFVKCP